VGGIMSSITINGDTSGSVILQANATAGSSTLYLPVGIGTITAQNVSTNIVSGTVISPSSGTSVLFTGIPSWAKRITVTLSNLGTGATSSAAILQLGSTTIQATGYTSVTSQLNNAASVAPTTYFALASAAAANMGLHGQIILNYLGNNIWAASWTFNSTAGSGYVGAGTVTMTGVVDRLQIGTVAGTAAFSTGSVNILYE
jgi:hypothetical protein